MIAMLIVWCVSTFCGSLFTFLSLGARGLRFFTFLFLSFSFFFFFFRAMTSEYCHVTETKYPFLEKGSLLFQYRGSYTSGHFISNL